MARERSKPVKRRRKRSPQQCANELAIERRRAKACDLRLAGWSIRDIAGHLKVSVGTVHSDIADVLERTKDAADNAVDKAKRLSLARLDKATRAIWPDVEAGRVEAVRELLRIEQRRAKVEGFDAADKHELSGPGGAPIPIDTRAALTAKLDELRARLAGAGAGDPEPGGSPGTAAGTPG